MPDGRQPARLGTGTAERCSEASKGGGLRWQVKSLSSFVAAGPQTPPEHTVALATPRLGGVPAPKSTAEAKSKQPGKHHPLTGPNQRKGWDFLSSCHAVEPGKGLTTRL